MGLFWRIGEEENYQIVINLFKFVIRLRTNCEIVLLKKKKIYSTLHPHLLMLNFDHQHIQLL